MRRWRPFYEWRPEGRIRNHNSKHILVPSDGMVRVELVDGSRAKVSQKYVIALAAHGRPPYWRCDLCSERVPYVPQQLNGQPDDTSADNLKWVPDLDAQLWHVMRGCLDLIVRCRPHESYAPRPWPGLLQYPVVYDDDGRPAGDHHMCHITTPKRDKRLNEEAC